MVRFCLYSLDIAEGSVQAQSTPQPVCIVPETLSDPICAAPERLLNPVCAAPNITPAVKGNKILDTYKRSCDKYKKILGALNDCIHCWCEHENLLYKG